MLTQLEKQSLQRMYKSGKVLLRDLAPEIDEILSLWFHEPVEASLRDNIKQTDLDHDSSMSQVDKAEIEAGVMALLKVRAVIEQEREALTQLSARVGGG